MSVQRRWSADSGPNYSGFRSGSAVRPFILFLYFLFYLFFFNAFLIPLFRIPPANVRTVRVKFYTSTVRTFVRGRCSLHEFVKCSLFYQNQHNFHHCPAVVNATCRRQRYSLPSATQPVVVNVTCYCQRHLCRRKRHPCRHKRYSVPLSTQPAVINVTPVIVNATPCRHKRTLSSSTQLPAVVNVTCYRQRHPFRRQRNLSS